MTKLEAWITYFKNCGTKSKIDRQAITIIEKLKETLENYNCGDDREWCDGCRARDTLSMDPENLGGPDDFQNKSQAV